MLYVGNLHKSELIDSLTTKVSEEILQPRRPRGHITVNLNAIFVKPLHLTL